MLKKRGYAHKSITKAVAMSNKEEQVHKCICICQVKVDTKKRS